MSSSSSKKKRAPRKKLISEPSELVPKSVCTRLGIALVMTGTISNARAKRAMKGEEVPDEAFDEVGVMCAWDVYDQERKARVRATLKPYFKETHITFIGVPNDSANYIKRLRDATYARIASPARKTRAKRAAAFARAWAWYGGPEPSKVQKAKIDRELDGEPRSDKARKGRKSV